MIFPPVQLAGACCAGGFCFAAEPTAASGGNREARLGQRSAFSKPRQGVEEKAANATRIPKMKGLLRMTAGEAIKMADELRPNNHFENRLKQLWLR